MKTYSVCLFDIDGTLLDTMELIYRSFEYTCRRFGDLKVERETIFSHVGIPLIEQLKLYLGDRSEAEYREIAEAHMAHQATIYREYLRIYPGVVEGLDELASRGIRLGIVTSRTRPSLLAYLDHFGIKGYFRTIATPESTRRHKPDPEPIEWALSQLGARPEESLFVGDAVFDIRSGRAAGVDTAFALWGPNGAKEISPEPHYKLTAFEELVPLFSSGG